MLESTLVTEKPKKIAKATQKKRMGGPLHGRIWARNLRNQAKQMSIESSLYGISPKLAHPHT